MKTILALGSAFALFLCQNATGDSITIKGGHTATGTILQTNASEDSILLLQNYGTAEYYVPIVEAVKIDEATAVTVPVNTSRTPGFKQVLLHLSRQPWAKNLKQIPATVVDKGILKFVPYVSFRCAEDYEVNIYGDLDKPAGIEVGLYRKLLADESAKENCLKLIDDLLPDTADRETLKKLNREKDNASRKNLAFEITPPTAEDAYGGWWVSVYDEKKLELSRASESEMKKISVATTTSSGATTNSQDNASWSASDLKNARPVRSYVPQTHYQPPASVAETPVAASPVPTYAPTAGRTYSPSTSPPSSGGSVYVRSYTRKDGTYVQAHTRSAARR
jgi:hypothetical protein